MDRAAIDRLIPLAKRLFITPVDETTNDPWLWEHCERVMHLTQLIAKLPEIGGTADLTALAAAALFHDAGWILDFQQGRYLRWQLLSRPTNDIQRELGAAMLNEEAGHLLPAPVVRLATESIRHCNDRRTELPEARILAEAEALDEVSTLYVLRQFRTYQAEGRPVQQLVSSWQRQAEYRYWDLRLSDGFRWETTRALAAQRLAAVDAFLKALDRDLRGNDVQQLLRTSSTPPGEAP